MNVENSMVVGAQDEYDALNREPTVCEQRKYTSDRARFINRLLTGQVARGSMGERYDLNDLWDRMPATFLDRHIDVENEELNTMYLSGKMAEWAKDVEFAAGKLADFAGFEA